MAKIVSMGDDAPNASPAEIVGILSLVGFAGFMGLVWWSGRQPAEYTANKKRKLRSWTLSPTRKAKFHAKRDASERAGAKGLRSGRMVEATVTTNDPDGDFTSDICSILSDLGCEYLPGSLSTKRAKMAMPADKVDKILAKAKSKLGKVGPKDTFDIRVKVGGRRRGRGR